MIYISYNYERKQIPNYTTLLEETFIYSDPNDKYTYCIMSKGKEDVTLLKLRCWVKEDQLRCQGWGWSMTEGKTKTGEKGVSIIPSTERPHMEYIV